MNLHLRYRRDCIRLRAESFARLEYSIVLSIGKIFLSRLGPCLFVWRRSECTGRPRLLSTWEHYQPAMRSMQRAANVAARAKYWEVRHAH